MSSLPGTPTSDTAPHPAWLATTPSLGVRLWLEDGQVCLQVANEGGRGAPALMLVIPVCATPAGWWLPAPGLVALQDAGTGWPAFTRLHLRRLPSTLSTPSTQRFSGDDWQRLRHGQDQVLVLVLFRRSHLGAGAGIGVGVGDGPAEAADAPPPGADLRQAVRFFFSIPLPPGWLRRGLVRLASADIPPTLPPTLPPTRPPTGTQAVAERQALPAQAFTLALSSCHYPAGLLDCTPQGWAAESGRPAGSADAALLRLAERLYTLAEPQRPSLLVLTGDQIYADPTAGLFDPRGATPPARRGGQRLPDDWLRQPYQHWLGRVGTQAVMGQVPSLMMMDDHEIEDNWQPLPWGSEPQARLRSKHLRAAGREAYLRYQRNLRDNLLPGVLWHSHVHRGIGIFMADTRTERSARVASGNPLRPRIVSRRQSRALSAWLAQQPAAQPAFVVSPAMLLPRRRASARHASAALLSDAWCGYPGSLNGLLALLWRLGRQNLVFLSGDEHLSCVVQASITDAARSRTVRLLSIHSSALYAPYPFANSAPEDFALPDAWAFTDPADPALQLRCSVALCGAWAPGDGFALIGLQPPADPGAAWQLSVLFDRVPGNAGPAPAPAPLTFALPSV